MVSVLLEFVCMQCEGVGDRIYLILRMREKIKETGTVLEAEIKLRKHREISGENKFKTGTGREKEQNCFTFMAKCRSN